MYGKYWANQNNVINLLVNRIFFLFQVPSISSAVHFAKMVIKCKCIHSYPLNITGEKKYCVPLERETRLMCATAIFEPNSIIISNNLRAIKSSILIDSNRTFSITFCWCFYIIKTPQHFLQICDAIDCMELSKQNKIKYRVRKEGGKQ